MHSFNDWSYEVSFAKFICEKIVGKLVKLIIENRYEVHNEFLEINLFGSLLDSEVCSL
jgi:hypothetical protein